MKDNSIIAIQDMGAAGLTSSSVEMASKGSLGIELDLSKVPCREDNMTPYEMMLSEMRRMLLILEDGKEKDAKKIFEKWDLDFVIIGKTTDTKKLILKFKGKIERFYRCPCIKSSCIQENGLKKLPESKLNIKI